MAWQWIGGDPDGLGWTVTIVYLLASALALLAARRIGIEDDSLAIRKPRQFWVCWAVALFVLGVNKELDVHDSIRHFLRNLAHEQGWYHLRTLLKLSALAVVIFGAVLVSLRIWRRFGWLIRDYRYAMVGSFVILLFVLGRATSYFASQVTWIPRLHDVHAWGVLEVVGAALVGWEAYRVSRKSPHRRLDRKVR